MNDEGEMPYFYIILDERYLAGYAAGIQRMQRALKQNNKSLLLRSFI